MLDAGDIVADAQIVVHSPVSIIVTDPQGATIDVNTVALTEEEILHEVPRTMYYSVSGIDQSGYPSYTVTIPRLKLGTYVIQVTPQAGTSPTDTYSLDVRAGGATHSLAKDVPISQIPVAGYRFLYNGGTDGVVFNPDTIAPTTTGAPSPAPNSYGWNNTEVVVRLSAVDNLGGSGVKGITYSLSGAQSGSAVVGAVSTSVSISTEGTTTLSYFATDNAGNRESAKTLVVRIDKTPPTVTFDTPAPAANAAGWNNTNVSVGFAVTDTLSGVATASASSPLVLSTEGLAVAGTVTVTDKAGNTAVYTSPSVKIDKTPPTVTCNVIPNLLWPPNHAMIPVNVSVGVSDTLSSPAGFALTSASSSEPALVAGSGNTSPEIQGFVIGVPSVTGQLRAERAGTGTGRMYTLTYQGFDVAGNSSSCSTTVTVPLNQAAGP